MNSFFKNDFKKIENYKKKNFNNKKQVIITSTLLTCYIKKIEKRRGRKKIFSDIFFVFKRLESFSSCLPKIYKLKALKHGKKNIKTKGLILIKLFLNFSNSINFINFIFIKHFYFYLKFLFNFKHKYSYLEEILKPALKKNIFVSKKTLITKLNIYKRWTDISRKFINFSNSLKKRNYKVKKKKIKSIKILKFIKTTVIFKSFFIKYFYNFIVILIKNYYKFVLYTYKKFRKNKLKI